MTALESLPPIYGLGYDAISKADARAKDENPEENLAIRLAEQREWAAENAIRDREGNLRRLVLVVQLSDLAASRSEFGTDLLLGRNAAMDAIKVGYWDGGHSPFPGCEPSSDDVCYVLHPLEILTSSEVSRISRKRDYVNVLEPIALDRDIPFWGAQITDGRLYDVSSADGANDLAKKFQQAHDESLELSKRIKRKLNKRAVLGGWSGRPPFGYELAKVEVVVEGRTWKVCCLKKVEAEAELLRESAWRILHGESLAVICRDLHRRGVRGRRGGSIQPISLKTILLSDYIIGMRKHQPTRVINGKRVSWGEAEITEGLWHRDRIIGPRTQKKLRRILASRHQQRSWTRASVVTGVATHDAPDCRVKLVGGTHRGKRVLRCSTRPPYFGCGHLCQYEEKIEDLVSRAVCFAINHDAFRAAQVRAHYNARELQKLEAEQLADEEELREIGRKRAANPNRPAYYDGQAEVVGTRMDKREHRLAQLRGSSAVEDVTDGRRGEDLLQAMGVAENQVPKDRQPAEWRARVIASVVKEVRVKSVGGGYWAFDPDTVTILWRDEPDPTAEAAMYQGLWEPAPRLRQTECKGGHDLTDPENVYLWRGHHQCRKCQAERVARYRERQRGY